MNIIIVGFRCQGPGPGPGPGTPLGTRPLFVSQTLLTNDTLPNYSFLKFGSSDIGLHVGTNEILGSRVIGVNEASEFMMRPRNGCLLYIHHWKSVSCRVYDAYYSLFTLRRQRKYERKIFDIVE